jgi:hypothetical protein
MSPSDFKIKYGEAKSLGDAIRRDAFRWGYREGLFRGVCWGLAIGAAIMVVFYA